MESNEEVVRLPAQYSRSNQQELSTMGNHQLIIISRLLQLVPNMRHVDDMFRWLSQICVQRLGIEVLQIWVTQNCVSNQTSTELRAMASQSLLLPPHIVVNAHVARVAEHVLSERRSIMPLPISSVFALRQTRVLEGYNLNFWGGYFLNNNVLLPPRSNDLTGRKVATPLSIVVSHFFQQMPNPRLLPTVGRILEKTISIASNRGLLLPAEKPARAASTAGKVHSKLATLIPQHASNYDSIQGINPFSDSVIIADKLTRRLYFAIDGSKNIAELAASVQLTSKDFYAALRSLLAQKHIQLYEEGGRIVNNSHILKEL